MKVDFGALLFFSIKEDERENWKSPIYRAFLEIGMLLKSAKTGSSPFVGSKKNRSVERFFNA